MRWVARLAWLLFAFILVLAASDAAGDPTADNGRWALLAMAIVVGLALVTALVLGLLFAGHRRDGLRHHPPPKV